MKLYTMKAQLWNKDITFAKLNLPDRSNYARATYVYRAKLSG